ncbi:hypothetical protein CEXT_182321 [Caerostris extrusa]|uniref:Uncharacterized protein n=1 Tax=Caerostris extrusa TaxID=172846 RepID=A0AAV4N4M5_CAEEX|nr:hypothetical protein CEXT_182321 [Caerostris extrusa]
MKSLMDHFTNSEKRIRILCSEKGRALAFSELLLNWQNPALSIETGASEIFRPLSDEPTDPFRMEDAISFLFMRIIYGLEFKRPP